LSLACVTAMVIVSTPGDDGVGVVETPEGVLATLPVGDWDEGEASVPDEHAVRVSTPANRATVTPTRVTRVESVVWRWIGSRLINSSSLSSRVWTDLRRGSRMRPHRDYKLS